MRGNSHVRFLEGLGVRKGPRPTRRRSERQQLEGTLNANLTPKIMASRLLYQRLICASLLPSRLFAMSCLEIIFAILILLGALGIAFFAKVLLDERRAARTGYTTATRDMVVSRAESLWPGEAKLVLSELDLYKGPGQNRIHMGILSLSNGSLEDLRQWVNVANVDYRELIMAAEYGFTKLGSQIRRNFREYKLPEN